MINVVYVINSLKRYRGSSYLDKVFGILNLKASKWYFEIYGKAYGKIQSTLPTRIFLPFITERLDIQNK